MSEGGWKTTVAVILALSAFGLTACGGDDGGAEAEAPAVKRPSAEPPDFHLAEYDTNTTWEQVSTDERVGSYLESAWHDPADYYAAKLIIDSRPAEGAPPPLAAAELARVQINHLPGYRERSLKRVKVGGHPAIRWAYDAGGRGYFAYFFEVCGTSIVVRGSTKLIAYEPFADFYHYAAAHVKPVCED